MTAFSANLGFLWTDRALPDAIRAAHAAGFDAVECHWPYDVPADQVRAALSRTGLKMLGLNTRPGDTATGDKGLAALPGREAQAQAAIDEAIDYAVAVAATNIHVMAGVAEGRAAEQVFLRNLAYACRRAAEQGKTILIEPLNADDAPGYFLNNLAQAARIIGEVAAPNLRLMFDCYHVGRTEGDVAAQLARHLPIVGHIQFAGVPDRGPPDRGNVDYPALFNRIDALGWTAPLGAEYDPGGDTDASLGWMTPCRG